MTDMLAIIIDGAPNLRDLGGYAAADGRRIRRRIVFRSDDLSELSRADLIFLASLDIRTVVDFRDRREVELCPDRLPRTVVNLVNIPIEAGSLMNAHLRGGYTRDNLMGMMVSVYRALVDDCRQAYRDFFAILSQPGNTPLLFHCTAGKDRTGVAAALFLLALGVDRKTVLDDYMLSRECLAAKYIAGEDYDPVLEPLYSVFPEFIQAALDVMDNRHGGPLRYLTDVLGVDIGLLRDLYTVDGDEA